jgi:hypothetical protein
VDLLDVNPTASKSTVLSLPKATTLYGPLPQQLQDPNSFASQLAKMLAARKQYNIPGATMNAVPPVGDPAVCVLEMTLPTGDFAITALNYGRSGSTSVQVDLTLIPPGIPTSQVAGQNAQDIVANQSAGTVGSDGKLTINLDYLSGKTLVVHRVGGVPIPPPTNSAPGPSVTSLPGSRHSDSLRARFSNQ